MTDNQPLFFKNRLIQIFRDHWEQFKQLYPDLVNEDIKDNVEKMMGCGLFSNGYAEYRCSCGHTRKVPFSCKSRFCLRCSKLYIDSWVARMKQTIFSKVNHRHIILTLPGSLWKYFHNKDMLKLLADCGSRLIKELVSICLKGKQIELGIISVAQTAGRKSTWNPHLHLLVTEGGLDRDNNWQGFYYFDYKMLRKKWMYLLLTSLKKALSYDPQALKIIDEIFNKRYQSGFIVRAKKEKVRRTDIIGYLIKYVASPPIALYRITDYDGNYIRYWYKEHPTDKKVFTRVSAYGFIRRLIQHIPPKGLKLIRHYGLYSRAKFNQAKEVIDKIFKYVKSSSQQFLSFLSMPSHTNYRERLQDSFGTDPLRCPNCGEELILYEVWHPKYGTVYDIYKNQNWRDYVLEKKEENAVQQGDSYLHLPQLQLSN